MSDPRAHWDAAYSRGVDRVSWFQPVPRTSLRLIQALGVAPETPVIDVGGGASPLAGALLDRGHTDLTVLDVSEVALQAARDALGARAARVTWVTGDLLRFTPERTYGVWHDRAVLHFLTDPASRGRYADLLAGALAPGGHAVIATFASDGPERCSGLPVWRADPGDLADLLGPRFTPVAEDREEHLTPGGATQRFAWLVARPA